MMPKYIDTDNILQGRFTFPQESEYARGWNDGLEAVTENAPAADVVPVVRGKFIELDIDDETKPSKFQCSACLHTEELFMITPKELEWKYCPHCGADMREDTFALYQIKTGPDFTRFRFVNMDWLRQNGETVRPERYEQQYSATLDSSASDQEALEEIFCRLNERRYDDYDGPSMSVSDVVVLSRNRKKSAWYCDSVGFEEVPEFLEGYHHE